jgi:hypothetical protein
MIASIPLAAAAVATAIGFPAAAASTGAGVQANPVCIPADAVPGHSYPETLYVTDPGSGPASFTVASQPETTGLASHLRQVPESWVTSGSASLDSGGSTSIPFTIAIPASAPPGPYWSYADAAMATTAASGPGVTVTFGAGGMADLVFTVGPSKTPPPPCQALDLAQSTGDYPGWPTSAFATDSWRQVYADAGTPEPPARPGPAASQSAAPVARFAPVAATSRSIPTNVPPDWKGWAILIGLILVAFAAIRRKLRG